MLCLTLWLVYLLSVVAADLYNPVFTETALKVNRSDATHNIPYSTETIVISQDFQVVSKTDKTYIRTNRVLIDFGLGCQNTTIETISQLNRNKTENDLFRWMESIALVQRGQCPWSEKLAHIQALAIPQQWNTTAILLYDNETHPEITVNTSLYQPGTSFPTYSAALPLNRSVASMADNDLTDPSIPVYFAPVIYGQSLQEKVRTLDPAQSNNLSTYYSLTAFLDKDTTSANGLIGSIRGYLAYIIALAAVFLIGVVFLRWWRFRRMRTYDITDMNGHRTIHLQSRTNQVDPLPVDIVNSLPIEVYYPKVSKNVNCVICLEDFIPEKTDVRILPCGHGFCVLCIDPWLTQKSTLCPICKWDCLPSDRRRESHLAEPEMRQSSSYASPSLEPTVVVAPDSSSSTGPAVPESAVEGGHTKP